jgi:hypothetical protein
MKRRVNAGKIMKSIKIACYNSYDTVHQCTFVHQIYTITWAKKTRDNATNV